MIMRAIRESDYEQVQSIYDRFYKEEFPIPDGTNSVFIFVIEEDGKIICSADLHTILEVTLMTDKSANIWLRKRALFKVLETCRIVAKNNKFNQVHAFVQEKIWKKALKLFGFEKCKGTGMVISSEEGG